MTKFKVGDKVRILDGERLVGNGDYSVTTGKEYEVISFHEKSHLEAEHIKVAGNFTKPFTICDWEYKYIELVNSKLTENQRITALENEVAELKLIVHELRERPQLTTIINNSIQGSSANNNVEEIIEFEGQQYRKVDREAHEGDVVVFDKSVKFQGTEIVTKGKLYKAKKGIIGELAFVDNEGYSANVYDGVITKFTPENATVYELIKPKPLTPNQQRATIIEKAKKFVEEKIGREKTVPDSRGSMYPPFFVKEFEFVVNTEKRTIVALCKGINGKVRERAIAKCDPSDVFNEHIGKAIALGRALGLDVSEFEQAVSPDKVVSGMKIKSTIDWSEAYFGKISKGDIFEVVSDEVKQPRKQCHVNSAISRNSEIIDDTKAIY